MEKQRVPPRQTGAAFAVRSTSFVGARGFEFPGEVVGQVDHASVLRLVGVVGGHVPSEVGEHLVAVHVLRQFHHGVENGAQ